MSIIKVHNENKLHTYLSYDSFIGRLDSHMHKTKQNQKSKT